MEVLYRRAGRMSVRNGTPRSDWGVKPRTATSEATRAIHGRNRAAEFGMDMDWSREVAEPVLRLVRLGNLS